MPRPDRHPTPEPALPAALRSAAATVAYAAVHTLFATHAAKRRAERLVGRDRARGWYRVAYNVHAAAGLGMLGAYVWRHRGPFAWHPDGPARRLLQAGQALAVGAFLKALWDAGIGDLSGLRPARDYLSGRRPLRPVPDAQGPREDDAGRPAPEGLSLRTRQPANFFILPVLWVVPSARAGWVGMSAAFSAYAVLGSWSSERRLLARWGPAMAAYQRSGVPFLVPAARAVEGARAVAAFPETAGVRAA